MSLLGPGYLWDDADVYESQRWIDAPVERRKGDGCLVRTGSCDRNMVGVLGEVLAYIELGKAIFKVGAISHGHQFLTLLVFTTALTALRFGRRSS